MTQSSRRLNIALAMSSFFPAVGGAQVTANNLGKYLTARGHNVVVFVSPKSYRALGNQRSRFPFKIVPMFPSQQSALPKLGSLYLKFQDIYLNYMQRKYHFDLWQSFGAYPTGVSVGHFTHPRGIPHVIRTIGYDVQKNETLAYGYRLNPKLDQLIHKWTPGVSRAIALTQSVVPDLIEIGVPRKNIMIVPCGVNYSRFNSIEINKDSIRQIYGIPKDVFTFITVGRNHPKKGFPILVQALAIMKSISEINQFHCVFVGKEMNQLQPLAKSLGIEGLVTFVNELGNSPEDGAYEIPSSTLIRLYRSVDACVFPSLIEAHSHINIEAMAAGLPVVSTDGIGVKDTVIDGINGLIATAGDPASLAEKMIEIQINTELGKQLTAQGFESVKNKYDWSVVGKMFEKMYLELTAT